MDTPLTVLVVGAGRFGRNYLNVFSTIAKERLPGLPRIGTVLLSRTSLPSAERTALALAGQPECPFDRVIGVAIGNRRQLDRVLTAYAPALVCIVARDRHVGDDIHATYARDVLDRGAGVLCEKPFCIAKKDGRGADRALALSKHNRADSFGLELPMAVVRNAMWADNRLRGLLESAGEIELLWEIPRRSDDLISDLALHPWSLLPVDWHLQVTKVRCSGNAVDIRAGLIDPQRPSAGITCAIRLACEGTFRAMRVDEHLFQFQYESGYQRVLASTPVKGPLSPGNLMCKGAEMVLRVANPLQQHIVAALKRKPLVDIGQTVRSQQFLESVSALSDA